MEDIHKNEKIAVAGGIFLFIIVLMIAASGILWPKVPEYGTFVANKSEEQIITDMRAGTIVEQEFTCAYDWEFITLDFSDHDLYIHGETFFQLVQKWDGVVIGELKIDNGDIKYGTPVKLYVEGGGKANKDYVLTISTLAAPDERSLGLYGYIPSEAGMACKMNGKVSKYAVSIGMHMTTACYKIHFLSVMGLLGVMFLLCVFFTLFKKGRPETLFLCIAIPMGLIFLSFLNVNIVHDGGIHLTNVYKYSNRLLGRGGQDSLQYVYLSKDELALREETDNLYILMGKLLHDRQDKDTLWQPYLEQRVATSFSILEYFPGVLGITLGRILGINAMGSLLLAKVFCLSFYIAVCYLAIRIAPFLKGGFVAAALIPMSLYQAAGITYDAVTTPIAYFVLAVILKGRENKVKKREWAGLLLGSMILGSCKCGVYIPILFLLVFVRSECNGGRKFKMKACLASWLLAAATMLFSFRAEIALALGQMSSDAKAAASAPWVTGDEPRLGLGYLFTEPVGFVRMLVHTIIKEADYYLGSMLGRRMAWSEEEISWVITGFFLILLALMMAWDEREQLEKISFKERLLAGAILLVELAGFHAIMLTDTRVGADIIFGVQGRYFLPLIPVFMFSVFSKARVKTGVEAGREFVLLSLAEILFVFNFMTIAYK